MKKSVRLGTLILGISLLLITSSELFGQKVKPDEVPDEVKQTLLDQQGEVKVSQWVLDGDVYVANFKVDGSSAVIYIQSDGAFIKSTTFIPKSTLPTAIIGYIEKNYPEFNIAVSEIREETNVKMYYYVEVKPEVIGAQVSVLTFDHAGKLLTRTDPEGFVTPELTPKQKVQQKADQELAEENAPKGKNNQKPKQETKPAQQTTQQPKQQPKEESDDPDETTQPKENKPATQPKTTTQPKTQPKTTKVDPYANGDAPAPVLKAFAKKVLQPEDVEWNTIDPFYVATCTVKEQKNELYFTKEGVWEKTYTFLPEEAITGAMLKHLESTYRGYEFITAVKETRADKQDKVLVEFYEKNNQKAMVSTSVVFDKLGRILKTYKAEEEQPSDVYAKLSIESINEKPNEIPELAIAAFKQKYPKITGVEWSEDDEGYFLASYFGVRGKEIVVMEGNGSILEIRTTANMDNISSNIEGYIKKNHKGCQIYEYYSVRGLVEKKNYYLVIIKDKKTNMLTSLKFTLAGQIMQ
jgi:hypothetical protein